MEKPLFGWALALPGGPKTALILGVLLILSSCKSTKQDETVEDQVPVEEYATETNEETESKWSPDPEGKKHPKRATAWHTSSLLLTNKKPPLKDIQACQSKMLLSAKSAQNEKEILKESENILTLIEQEPEVYHWCFYTDVNLLDHQIRQVGLPLQERSLLFLETMKKLWILARSLDRHSNTTNYFRYLRIRYIELSQTIFGRHVTVIGLPMGPMKPKTKSEKKPAAEFSD